METDQPGAGEYLGIGHERRNARTFVAAAARSQRRILRIAVELHVIEIKGPDSHGLERSFILAELMQALLARQQQAAPPAELRHQLGRLVSHGSNAPMPVATWHRRDLAIAPQLNALRYG